ncbi:MAG: extracellular solute-binding protein [bacterium]|nr:extracellular solute-binding protein [bacterium]
MKKQMAVVAALTLGLTGCAQYTDTDRVQEDGSGERMKISVAFWNAEEALAGDGVLDAIEEKFQVELEPFNMTWNDYYQKVDRWASTDSLPDLFVGDFRNSKAYYQWIQQGLLCAVPKDLSDYPNLESYLDGMEETQSLLVDGMLYCIPRQTYPAQEWTSIDRVLVYRWDLAQRAGIRKEPENWEEFQKMILAIVETDPEGKGIQGMTAGSAGMLTGWLLPYASSIAASNDSGFYWKKDEDGICKPAYFVDDMTAAFQLARDMYEAGVIERDIIQETENGAREKFLQGEYAAILYSGGFGTVYNNVGKYWEEVHGRGFTEDVRALGLMPDVNGNKAYPIWGYAWSESYISSKVEEDKLDKILQIYDYLLSEEGAFFAAYGPEGEFYEIEDGRARLCDSEADVTARYPSCAMLSTLVRWDISLYDDRFPSTIPEDCVQVNYELFQEAREAPIPEYEPECRRIMREEQIEFSLDLNNDFLSIMTGTRPVEEMWEEIKRGYEEKGLQEMIDTVNSRL